MRRWSNKNRECLNHQPRALSVHDTYCSAGGGSGNGRAGEEAIGCPKAALSLGEWNTAADDYVTKSSCRH